MLHFLAVRSKRITLLVLAAVVLVLTLIDFKVGMGFAAGAIFGCGASSRFADAEK